jgi:creatinine amidohydrolase
MICTEPMGALKLDELAWPDIQRELEGGRDTVVVAFGATEQHGPHLPLGTDALLGDHLARLVAERLNAFVAPTVRVGCSEHHLGFPGTLSLSAQTFHSVVADLVGSLARGGFGRAVLIPTHGGNFAPLAAAVDELGPVEGIEVAALTDIAVLMAIATQAAEEHGVPLGEAGLHAGEWETSMLLATHPQLVRGDRMEAGFTGPLQEALERMLSAGVRAVSANGVIGDPARASAEHGARYWHTVLDAVLREIS